MTLLLLWFSAETAKDSSERTEEDTAKKSVEPSDITRDLLSGNEAPLCVTEHPSNRTASHYIDTESIVI